MNISSWGNRWPKIALVIACLVALWDRRTYAFRVRNTGLVAPKAPITPIANQNFIPNEEDSYGNGVVATQTQGDSLGFQPEIRETYNKHPRFVLGSYRLFNLDLRDHMDEPGIVKIRVFLPYLYLLTKCDIVLESMGTVRLAGFDTGEGHTQRRNHASDSPEGPPDATFGADFTDKSLSIIRAIYDPKLMIHLPEGFFDRLESRDIETFEVADLIAETREPAATREELREFFEQTALGGVDPRGKLRNIVKASWDYMPSAKNVRVQFSLVDAPGQLVVNFKLLPFTKPLVVDSVNVKSYSDVSGRIPYRNADRKIDSTYLAFGKLRPTVNDTLRPRVARQSENSRVKTIKMRSGLRREFNDLFKLLQSLNGRAHGSGAQGPESEPDPQGPPPRRLRFPLAFKAVGVYLNSKPLFLLPLVTFVDMRERRAYLCNRSIPIPASPSGVWDPFKTPYGRYNADFVPEDYRHAGFFSSAGLTFRDAELLRALATFPAFVRLVHGLCNPGAEGTEVPPDFSVSFKKLGPMGGEAHEGGGADVYEVNERFKMIYKNSDRDLLVNLIA